MSTSILSNSTELYEKEQVKTEYNASRLIKEWENNYPVEFLDVPWSVGINDKLPLPEFPEPSGLDRYVVCQHIRFRELLPYWKSIGVKHVFSPHCVLDDDLMVCPFPHHAPVKDDLYNSIKDRVIWASFVGATYTHPVRKQIVDYFKDKQHYIVQDSGQWHFEKSPEVQKHNRDHYHNVLSNSIFAFVPPGTGPGTIRLWEAMGYGCVGIVTENQELAMPGSLYQGEEFDGLEMISIQCLQDVQTITTALTIEDIIKRSTLAKMYYLEHQGDNLINSIKYRFMSEYGN